MPGLMIARAYNDKRDLLPVPAHALALVSRNLAPRLGADRPT
jgi:hypothetical protein